VAKKTRKIRPATTIEGRENQLISLAADLAEKQLQDGSASAAVITHFLKLASTREQLEQERLKRENLLLSAKVDAMASARRIEELYETALNAMRQYAGRDLDVDGL
jgi:hypothetical protein